MLDYFCTDCKKRWRFEQMAQTSHADGGWLICPSCRCDLVSDVIEMVAKDALHPLEIGETMTHYRVKGEPPVFKEVEVCDVDPTSAAGVVFKVGGVTIQRLRPSGVLYQYEIDSETAAELGLQLDERGRVKCVD